MATKREDPKYVKTYFEEMKQHNVPFNTRMQWLSRVYGGRNGYSSEELYKIVTGKQKDQYFIFPFVKHAPPEVNRILERTYRRHRAQGATKEAAAIASWAKVKQAGYVKEHKLQPSWVKKEAKMPTKKNYANPGLDWAASLPHFTPDIPTPVGLRHLLARGSAVATTVGKRVGRSMSLATKAALMSVVINDLLERLSKKGHPYIPRIQPDLELLSSFELKEHVVKYIDAIPTPLLQKLRQNTGRVAVQARKGAERGLLVWLLGFLTSELMGRGISRPKKEQTLIVPQLPRVAPQQQYMRIAETGERLPRSGFQRMNLKNMADDLGPMPTWKKSNRFGRNSRVLAAMAPIVGLAARQIALGLRDKPTLIDEARARWNSSKKRAKKRAKQKRYAIDMRRLRKLGQMGLKTGGKVVKTGGKVLGTASNIAFPLILASDIVGMMRQPVDQGQRPKPPVPTTTIGGQPTTMKRKKQFQQQEVVTMYPMQSQAQRRWMHATHPAMAEEWEEHTPKGKKLPEHKKKKKTYAMSPEFVEAVRRTRTNAAMQPPRPIRTSTIALVLGAGLASKAMNRRKELEKQQQQHRERLAKLNAKTKVKMAVTKQKQYASPAAVLKLAPRIKSLAGFKGESKAADAIAKDILAWARQRAGRMRTLADNAGKTVIPVGKSKITANRFFGKEAVEWDTVADQLSDMAKRHKLEKRAAVAAATTAATAAAGATGREVGKKEENARIKSAIG